MELNLKLEFKKVIFLAKSYRKDHLLLHSELLENHCSHISYSTKVNFGELKVAFSTVGEAVTLIVFQKKEMSNDALSNDALVGATRQTRPTQMDD